MLLGARIRQIFKFRNNMLNNFAIKLRAANHLTFHLQKFSLDGILRWI